MNWLAILTAGIAYYLLGGIWFSPRIFGKQWDKAIGFDRPDKWKPGAIFYVGPLIGCLIAALATALLIAYAQPQTFLHAVLIGVILGFGYGGTITGVNAISSSMSRPGLFTIVTGGYHVIGLVLCTVIIYAWS